jgi:hypothetical protein
MDMENKIKSSKSPARNKVAAVLAIVSGSLFIISGYSANLGIYRTIESGLKQYTAQEIWELAIIPVNMLALVAQLGGIVVLIGGLLFYRNHVSSGKFLVLIGTGQGIITVIVGLILEFVQGGILAANGYLMWLATSAIGLGILFSVIARSIARKPIHSNAER